MGRWRYFSLRYRPPMSHVPPVTRAGRGIREEGAARLCESNFQELTESQKKAQAAQLVYCESDSAWHLAGN